MNLQLISNSKKRSLVVRSVIIVAYILLAIIMFVSGRSHTVLIDNHAAEDGSYKAIKGMTVSVNNSKPSEFMKGDRDKFVIKGQTLKVKVQSFDGKIDTVYTFKIPLKTDSVLISIPKLAAGMDESQAMEEFQLN